MVIISTKKEGIDVNILRNKLRCGAFKKNNNFNP